MLAPTSASPAAPGRNLPTGASHSTNPAIRAQDRLDELGECEHHDDGGDLIGDERPEPDADQRPQRHGEYDPREERPGVGTVQLRIDPGGGQDARAHPDRGEHGDHTEHRAGDGVDQGASRRGPRRGAAGRGTSGSASDTAPRPCSTGVPRMSGMTYPTAVAML